jgi:hypothetical protein
MCNFDELALRNLSVRLVGLFEFLGIYNTPEQTYYNFSGILHAITWEKCEETIFIFTCEVKKSVSNVTFSTKLCRNLAHLTLHSGDPLLL